MKKYIDYLANKFGVWQMVIAILGAVAMLFAIAFEMSLPMAGNEMENHYSQLEIIKQDVANLSKLEDANITINEDGIKVVLNGKQYDIKVTFDNSGNYVESTIMDNRIGSNIIISLFIILAAFCCSYLVSYAILLVLCIPILVHAIIVAFKKKIHSRKTKEK